MLLGKSVGPTTGLASGEFVTGEDDAIAGGSVGAGADVGGLDSSDCEAGGRFGYGGSSVGVSTVGTTIVGELEAVGAIGNCDGAAVVGIGVSRVTGASVPTVGNDGVSAATGGIVSAGAVIIGAKRFADGLGESDGEVEVID